MDDKKEESQWKKRFQRMGREFTAWELVIERRSCSFSCSAADAFLCSLETIVVKFSLLFLSQRLLLFFFSVSYLSLSLSLVFSFFLSTQQSSQVCLKEEDGWALKSIWSSCFLSHMTASVSQQHKNNIVRFSTYQIALLVSMQNDMEFGSNNNTNTFFLLKK